MRTILSKNLVDVEGSAAYKLNQRFPSRACHDGLNYIYADIHADAINPIIVSDLFTKETTNDQKAFIIAGLMTAEDRSRHIHISNSDCSQLFKHPAWRIWCFSYETENSDELKADWAYLEILLGDNWPGYSWNRGKDAVREIIKSVSQ